MKIPEMIKFVGSYSGSDVYTVQSLLILKFCIRLKKINLKIDQAKREEPYTQLIISDLENKTERITSTTENENT